MKQAVEREMTKSEKAKEKRLKNKYDDSGMKDSMKDQYGDDWKNVYYATIRKKAMASFQNNNSMISEGEAGDHERMYKVVHVKKGVMDIKAKTSYEAAKKFAKEKGLKSTAGVDTHLYPLEEGMMDDEVKAILMKYPKELAKLKASQDLMDVYDTPLYQELFSYYADSGEMPYGVMKARDGDPVQFISDELDDMGIFEGYKVLPKVDTDKYPEIPGLEGPFQTMAGKPIYYDPKEGSYYDKDTDMYLTYAEFQALDNDRTGMKEASMPVNATPKMHKLDVQEDAPISQMSRADLLDYLNMSEKDAEGMSTQELMDMAQDVTMDQMENKKSHKLKLPGHLSGVTKYRAVEGDGRKKGIHPKGHPMRQKQQAAIHANSVDLNAMRDALKLDERTDANTVVAEYTRACLDLSHNTWGKVCEQIDHVRSFVKEDVDVENVKIQLRKMHEREALDRNIVVKENIDKLRQIVKDKSAMSIKFADGTMKVDMTTANIFVQMYDKMKERNQKKIDDMMQTKAGFLKVLDFFYGAMK